jgi:hypothetical protein
MQESYLGEVVLHGQARLSPMQQVKWAVLCNRMREGPVGHQCAVYELIPIISIFVDIMTQHLVESNSLHISWKSSDMKLDP